MMRIFFRNLTYPKDMPCLSGYSALEDVIAIHSKRFNSCFMNMIGDRLFIDYGIADYGITGAGLSGKRLVYMYYEAEVLGW